MTHKVLDLFSGIGGFSLGLQNTGGFETVAFCEIEPYCLRVLNKHWKDVPIYNDIKELTYEMDCCLDIVSELQSKLESAFFECDQVFLDAIEDERLRREEDD